MFFDEIKKREEKNYRTYITDSLKNITEVILKMGGANDPDIPRYIDMIDGNKEQSKSRTAEEAIELFRKNCEAFQNQKQKDGEENG